jgi:hypothetical protein
VSTEPAAEPTPEHPFTQALRTWEAWSSADTWTRVVADAHMHGQALDGLGDLEELTSGPDPLDALRANREVVEFTSGWQWQAMRAAREQGCSWHDIGRALDLDAEQARGAYLAAVERQELAAPALSDLGSLLQYDPRWPTTTTPTVSAEVLPPLLPGDDWRGQAACRHADPRLFDFDPETDPEGVAEPARRICADCPVRADCLSYALSLPAEDDCAGIYGGLTPAERSRRRGPSASSLSPVGRRSWRLAADPTFARASFDLATGIGVERAAEALGVASRTLQRAWRRHGLGPHPAGRPAQPAAGPWLIQRAFRELGWAEHETRQGYLVDDPEFAVSSFRLAGTFGTIRAAKQLGVSTRLLYRAWDRQALGRPMRPEGWTKQFTCDRELVEQAFALAREQSILAAASAFQVSAPTLRRAFAHHGLGHPHAGLDRAELMRRWSTQAQDAPDHHHRRQRRSYRARQRSG